MVTWSNLPSAGNRFHGRLSRNQVGTLITTGSLGTGFVAGLIAVAVFVAVIVALIVKANKNIETEYSLNKA